MCIVAERNNACLDAKTIHFFSGLKENKNEVEHFSSKCNCICLTGYAECHNAAYKEIACEFYSLKIYYKVGVCFMQNTTNKQKGYENINYISNKCSVFNETPENFCTIAKCDSNILKKQKLSKSKKT